MTEVTPNFKDPTPKVVSSRGRIRPRSEKAIAKTEGRKAACDEVLRRDRRCVILGLDPAHKCIGGDSYHELRKRSAGGSITDPMNIVLTCSVGNGLIEDYPDWAHALGLVARFGDALTDCWVRMDNARRGLVDLTGVRTPHG